MDNKLFHGFKKERITLRERLILPFLKTYVIDEEGCQLSYKIFNGKIYFVRENNLLPEQERT